jgi:hypothetical protein
LNRRITTVAICLLILIVTLPGCDTGRPSAADIEQAVLRDMATQYYYQWVTGVEIIKYGEPWTGYLLVPVEYEFWPVRLYLVGDQRREEKDIFVYKDLFGDWRATP